MGAQEIRRWEDDQRRLARDKETLHQQVRGPSPADCEPADCDFLDCVPVLPDNAYLSLTKYVPGTPILRTMPRIPENAYPFPPNHAPAYARTTRTLGLWARPARA